MYIDSCVIIGIGVTSFIIGWIAHKKWAYYKTPQVRCLDRRTEELEIFPIKLQASRDKLFFLKEDGKIDFMCISNLRQYRRIIADAIGNNQHLHIKFSKRYHFGDKNPFTHRYIEAADADHVFVV